MKSKISALVDDELDIHDREGVFSALRGDPEAAETWRLYHLVGDSIRRTGMLSATFSERFSKRLADEPVVIAPGRLELKPARARWVAMSAAASLAAFALVGWLAFAPGPGGGGSTGDRGTHAQTLAPAVAKADANQARHPAGAKAAMRSSSKSLPGSARDYLLAHQAYSPRATVQGIAPNVQTVSDDSATRDAR